MTRILLAWQAHPQPQGTNFYPHDLAEADAVVALFKQASRYRAQITDNLFRPPDLRCIRRFAIDAGGIGQDIGVQCDPHQG